MNAASALKDKRVWFAVGAVALAASWWLLKSKTSKLTMKSTVTLSTGAKMPLLGFGTWRAGPGEVAAAVKTALLYGYRHIDCAWAYRNESEVGEGIKQAIAESKGKLTRNMIFVTTKLWNQFHQPEQVEEACRDSLNKLGLEYVDLYLMHWPVSFNYHADDFLSKLPDGSNDVTNVPIRDTWQAMEPLVAKGLVKAIGISNFTKRQIEDLLSYAKVKPVVHQCEAHPHFPNVELAKFSKDHGMAFTAYSSLGKIWDGQDSCMDEKVVQQVSKKLNKSPAQVLLRWGLQQGYIIIPKSANPKRVAENANLFDFEISQEDMDKLTALGAGRKRKNRPVWATYFDD
eukprot:TRINITY_DN3020_c0_g1_i1.p1 TRINITY_DN3020_c0_g1~~TRINITY_DN3020_c0_g1_i1.p1  ORF type:complete len:343 (-),score=84.97 TRINITY_DN3020_c0_g1_i1:724-1752(-)